MRTITRAAVVACTAIASVSVQAQSFQYADFADVSALTFNGSASQSANNRLRLVDNAASTTGSAWYTTPVSVYDGFDTTFTYTVSGSGPAEGFAFVIHDSAMGSAALGGDLWGLGYGDGPTSGGIDNSLAIEFDFVQQGFTNDRNDNHLSVHSQGVLPNTANEGASLGRSSPSFSLAASHTVRVEYVPGRLKVWVDNMSNPRISVPYRLTAGGSFLTGGGPGPFQFTNGNAYVGFTASTGLAGSTKRAEIQTWDWASLVGPHDCYDGTLDQDLLRINGSDGGFFRTVEVATADPFTLDIDAPVGMTTAPFALFAALGVADGTNAVTFPQGTLCFPAAPGMIDLGLGPAPTQFAVPPGIPLTLTLTLQAVIGNDPFVPTSLGITNAIVLDIRPGPAPTIDSVEPLSAVAGAAVTIMGSGFSPSVVVEIDGAAVSLTSVAADEIEFTNPAGVLCDATLEVRNPDGQSATKAINPTPTAVLSASSAPASGGATVIATGAGFGEGTVVTVGGAVANVLTSTPQAIVFQVPAGVPGQTSVLITAPGGCSTSIPFTYF